MKRRIFYILATLAAVCLMSCNKPDPVKPVEPVGPDEPVEPVGPDEPDEPDVPTTEITINNAAPGGFIDGGTQDWNE